MVPLPIDEVLPEILAALRRARTLVLAAPPGAGKTTRVPPAVLRTGGEGGTGGLLDKEHPNLILLQPRRVAARAAAARIAEENGWTLGGEVGYHVRFDKRMGPGTRLRVLTEGILTRQLVEDPYLEGVGAVVLDEFHERSIHTDMAIALLREIRQTVRPDLILIVMSATLEAEPVAAFLGRDGTPAPVVRSAGRLFPVEIVHAPAADVPLAERMGRAILRVVGGADAAHEETGGTDSGGDVLAFLPGVEEIRRTARRIEEAAHERDLRVLALHGSLSLEEQTAALRPDPAGRRKVVLATNIAETSLTIDGVRTVIDCGLARVAGYDAQRGLDRLELKQISKASAAQRAGRAGRTAPGRCIRLYSAREERMFPEYELPEIRRVDLCATLLMLHAWGMAEPRNFGWYEPPAEETLAAAERLLALLGALSAEAGGRITDLGRRMLAMPVHPRLAALLIAAAERGLAAQGAAIAALLSEKDIVLRPSGPAGTTGGFGGPRGALTASSSDLLWRMQLLEEAERARFAVHLRDRHIDPHAARQVARVRDELLRVAQRVTKRAAATARQVDETELLKLPLHAYPDRVARRRGDTTAGVMVGTGGTGGGGIKLAPESSVTRAEFFLALDARQDERSNTREAVVQIASVIEPGWLEELFPEQIRHVRGVGFDAEKGRVIPLNQTFYRDLLLAEDRHGSLDPAQAAEVLATAARPLAAGLFARDEKDGGAANLLARLELLRRHAPEHPWPALGPDELGDLLATICFGKRSLDDVNAAPLAPLVRSTLQYPLDRLVDELAPETLAVPSGSRIHLDYTPVHSGQLPILAVRLQEMFGLLDTPRIVAGRVPVLLHLLSPGFRPVQVTADLRSFWRSAYFEVRKDLRIRYPKHAWPEDPLTAMPVAKGRLRH